jgi:hypothetical protein
MGEVSRLKQVNLLEERQDQAAKQLDNELAIFPRHEITEINFPIIGRKKVSWVL